MTKPSLGVILGPVLFALALALPALAQIDPRLDQALSAFDAGDTAGAQALPDAVDAKTPQAQWELAEIRATIAHLSGDDADALAQLQPLVALGQTLFGAEDPRLIPVLRMLSASQANLGQDAASTMTTLHATRLGRVQGGEDLLLTLSDLSRDRIDSGDTASAALLAAEMVIQDTADDGTPGPYAQEGGALWALALLRAGHADEGLAHLLPVLRLENPTEDVADLVTLFDNEADVDDSDVDAWTTRALAIEKLRDQSDSALLHALQPLSDALGAGDPVAADIAGRRALAMVALDDPLVTASYYALLLTTQPTHPDLAATWALRLADMPPYYLASLENDPVPVLETTADWLLNQGRVGEGVTLSEAIATLASLRDPAQVPAALARLGSSYSDAGRQAEARATLQQALAADIAPSLAVQIQSDLALLARDQNDATKAETAYAAALTLLSTTPAGDDPKAWAFILADQRDFLHSQGRVQDALAAALQAVAQITAHSPGQPDPALMVPALRDLAASQLDAGDAQGADLTLHQALQLPDADQLPRLRALQAAVQGRLGLPVTLPSDLLTPANGDLPSVVAVIEAATTAQTLGDTATAKTLMTMALSALPPEHPMRAYLQAGRASLEAATDPQAALDDLRLATTALTQPDRRDEPQARDHLALHVAMALYLAAKSNDNAAQGLASEAFLVAQRVGDISAGAALSKAAARLQGDGPKAAELAQTLQDADRTLDLARQTLITRLATGADASAETGALTLARSNRATLLSDLAHTYPNYAAFADPKPLDISAAAALLHENEALILFASADPATAGGNATGTVFAITQTDYMTASLPPRTELVRMARDLRCAAALTDPSCGTGRKGTRGAFTLDTPKPDAPPFDFALARQAYLGLIDPVKPLLQGKTALIIVPDRSLAALPFHLLLTADTSPDTPISQAPWLIRQTAITILPSVANLAALRSKTQQPSHATLPFLGIGDPLLGSPAATDCAKPPSTMFVMALAPAQRGGAPDLTSLSALPDTRCELQRAAELFGTPYALLLQAHATETRVKALSESGDLARYHVISFATHGLIAGELGAQDAGLVLTPPATPTPKDDGLLTTADIAALRLDADFVILSACNTAAGSADRAEGLSGLASAFFLAGARSLLVSHWPVYSDAATRLTSAMFEALAQDSGMGRAEALRRAMLSVLDDPDATARELHPAYWAPFLIAGEGD